MVERVVVFAPSLSSWRLLAALHEAEIHCEVDQVGVISCEYVL